MIVPPTKTTVENSVPFRDSNSSCEGSCTVLYGGFVYFLFIPLSPFSSIDVFQIYLDLIIYFKYIF